MTTRLPAQVTWYNEDDTSAASRHPAPNSLEARLVSLERRLVRHLRHWDRRTVVAVTCYPPVLITFARQAWAIIYVNGSSSTSSDPFQVLCALICCAVLGATEEGLFGLQLSRQLNATKVCGLGVWLRCVV